MAQEVQETPKKLRRAEEDPDIIYNSKNNWSIMIKDELNEVRNEIMRRTKSNQIKRRLPTMEGVKRMRTQAVVVNQPVRKTNEMLDKE